MGKQSLGLDEKVFELALAQMAMVEIPRTNVLGSSREWKGTGKMAYRIEGLMERHLCSIIGLLRAYSLDDL